MKLNQNTTISLNSLPSFLQQNGKEKNNPSIVLVPYNEIHVPTYHSWMQDAKLLEMTASERLSSLDEEYESMRQWRTDEKKLTFIILDTSVSPNFMVGDVNVCFLESDDGDDDDDNNEKSNELEAEVDVMIAEHKCRRKGYAQLSLLMIMAYVLKHFNNIPVFIAKILKNNQPSIKLFEDKLKFKKYKEIKVFEEIHFRRVVDGELTRQLDKVESCMEIQDNFTEKYL